VLGAGLLALGVLWPRVALAQEWYELYASGVEALRDGQAGKAADLLRRAVRKRPEPGVAVPTYGTNFEPRYFPYLRLAEAYLQLEAAEEARKALETSARLGIEPSGERSALEARVRAALDTKRSPPGPTPQVPTVPAPDPASAPPAHLPAAPGPAAPVAPAASTEVPPPLAAPAAVPTPRSAVGVGGPLRTPKREVLPTLDVTSDPPGAQVFLDGELVGRTDPETGLLRLRALSAGRHRLRLSSEGRDDVIREIEIAESRAFEVVLPHRQPSALPSAPPAPPGADPPPTARPDRWTILGLALIVILALGLWVRSLAKLPTGPADRRETPASATSRRDSGTGEVFPMPFGDYSLLGRLGKGGMAVVYEAERRGERFALKRPLAGFLDDTRYRERFLREAELGRTLHHPNIIRIFDRGQVGDIPYFAMELVHGETLRECLDREGRLDATLATRVTAQVAEALDYAHHKGVIHRDLKPSNIMLDGSQRVKVMDYGIARAQHLEGLTTTGSFLGTPNYAAPETVDAVGQPASDVYSLGVVFFEMLTGSLPFRGESAFAVLRKHCTTPPPVPSSLNYALSDELDRIVLRLLSKEPADRPTTELLLNELSDYLAAGR
jgi:hypothetical protein